MEDRMKCILIVDDNSDIRFIFRSTLEPYGYHCDEARNGLEALEKIEAEEFALILLDYSMPVMNGLEVIRRLKQDSGSPCPQIVMMTAHSDYDLRIQALDAGATAVLSKPFDLDHLLWTVERTLKNGHSPIPVPSQAFVSG